MRVAIDVDASWRALGGRLHVGVRRSPVHSPEGAAALARAIVARPALRLVGLMSYEAQIAGLGDRPPGRPWLGAVLRAVQRASARELAARRGAVVAAVRAVAPLELVNGGGTGSVEGTAAEAAVTEVTAGSGLYGPTLFDAYRSFRPRPAALFALPVVRRPGPRRATLLGGGYLASGAPGGDRLPRPVLPRGLRLDRARAPARSRRPPPGPPPMASMSATASGCATPRRASCASASRQLHLLQGDRVVGTVPTYRGEGATFL